MVACALLLVTPSFALTVSSARIIRARCSLPLAVKVGDCVTAQLAGALCPCILRVLAIDGDVLTCALAGCPAKSCIGRRDPRGLFVVSVGDVRRVLPALPFSSKNQR